MSHAKYNCISIPGSSEIMFKNFPLDPTLNFGPQSIWNQWHWGQKLIPMQSVPVTTDISSNIDVGEVYSLQHYVIKFESGLQQVGDFLQFPPPIKLTVTIN